MAMISSNEETDHNNVLDDIKNLKASLLDQISHNK